MIITRLMGGLGNQMFQYAAGRALSLRLGVPLKLDLSWFDDMQDCTPREYMLHAFPIMAIVAEPDEVESIAYRKRHFFEKLLHRSKRRSPHYVAEPSFSCWYGFTSLIAPVYLDGYWQQEQYFVDIVDDLRRDFAYPELHSVEAKAVARQIAVSSHSISIHIRRGDYISNPEAKRVLGTCPKNYYQRALQRVMMHTDNQGHLFLFSDEPELVHESFDTQGIPATIVKCAAHADAPWHDMHLMSLCKHHIIANSSFSWWGAWLSVEGSVTVAPQRWFAEEARKHENPAAVSWVTL